jgi:N-acetylglucosamine transport system permease protein
MLVMPLFKMATSMNLIGSRWTLMILYIAVNVPFGVFFLSGFFISLPKALEEAAEIDGCTPSEAFWKIMFPLAQPGIMTLTIFNFINIWNEYFMALIFANKTELRTVSTGLQAIVQSMKYSGDWAGLFAGVIIVFLPTFLLYIFLSNKIIAGVTGGAVKG